MRIEDYPTEPRYTATVLSSQRLTKAVADAEVRELVLEIDHPDFDYEIGQCIGVLATGPAEFGSSLHHRLYTIADTRRTGGDGLPQVTIVVRRCNYIDEYSGEQYSGINSNYLCDRQPDDQLQITGPFGLPFEIPADRRANLFLIGLGTGIAPFRALVRHIYEDAEQWQGKIRLLYGAQSGLELVYMNDERDDFARYYDQETFQAIKALSPRPEWSDPIAWNIAVEDRAEEIWELLTDEHTHVYVAGLKPIRDAMDDLFSNASGSPEAWQKRKAELIERGRWAELLYDG